VPDLLDLTWMRIELEALALRLSIERGDIAWEAALVGAHHTLMATPVHLADGAVNPAWMEAHSAFHGTLASACGSPLLIRIRQQLFQASEIYRYWSDRVRTDAHDEVPRAHTALLDAALARDADLAVTIATDHIQKTTQHLLASYEADGEEPVAQPARSRSNRRPKARSAAS
jgi:DNA-binding GntR family transcriptional regulator